MRTSACHLAAAVICCLAATGCQEIDLIDPGICGNKVTESEAGEDCDGQVGCRPPDAVDPCRYHCDEETPCPGGFGCGVDHVCRRASGVYSIIELDVSFPSLGLELADLDNDGRRDLVRTSADTTFIHFFDDGVISAKVLEVPRIPSPPMLGDLTGDGLDDFAFREPIGEELGAGLAVYRAQSDRTLASTTYSSIPFDSDHIRMVSGNFLPPAQDDELFAVADQTIVGLNGGGEASLIATDWSEDAKDARDVVGMVAANFDDQPTAPPCEEIAIAAANTQLIAVISPCREQGGNVVWSSGLAAVKPPVALPAGSHVYSYPESNEGWLWPSQSTEALFAIDLNDDQRLDLVIVTAEDVAPGEEEEPAIHIAFGLGDGTFNSTPPTGPPAPGDQYAAPWEPDYNGCDSDLGLLLAVGHFNEDTRVDLLTETAMLVSSPNGTHDYFGAVCDEEWTRAVVGHFNNNTKVDVAAARGADSGIDFFDGAGDGTFSRSTIPSKLPAAFLSAGDFDGDQVGDLAFVELGSDPNVAEEIDEDLIPSDTTYVAFGAVAGKPEPPRAVGNLKRVRSVVTGRLEGGDATDDLLILAKPAQKKLGLAVIGGNAHRQLHAPFIFSKAETAVTASASVVEWALYGMFSDEWDHGGMAVLTVDNPYLPAGWRLWQVASDDDATLAPGRAGKSKDDPSPLDFKDCQVGVIDLQDDWIDEVVIFCDEELSIFNAAAGGFIGAEKVTTTHTVLPNDVFETGEMVDRPTVRDVDGDGLLDVALLDRDRNIVIYWNDGSGSLGTGAGGETVVASPVPDEPLDAESVMTLDFAFINADGDEALELLVLNWTDGVRLLEIDADTLAVQTIEAGTDLPFDEEDIWVFGDVVTAGDFDGDGVDDIALGDYFTYGVLRGGRVRP
jgi:hypothetical protein